MDAITATGTTPLRRSDWAQPLDRIDICVLLGFAFVRDDAAPLPEEPATASLRARTPLLPLEPTPDQEIPLPDAPNGRLLARIPECLRLHRDDGILRMGTAG